MLSANKLEHLLLAIIFGLV